MSVFQLVRLHVVKPVRPISSPRLNVGAHIFLYSYRYLTTLPVVATSLYVFNGVFGLENRPILGDAS